MSNRPLFRPKNAVFTTYCKTCGRPKPVYASCDYCAQDNNNPVTDFCPRCGKVKSRDKPCSYCEWVKEHQVIQ